MAGGGESGQGEGTARRPRGRLAVAAVAVLTWAAGFLAAWLVGRSCDRPPEARTLEEIAGLRLPKLAASLDPQYRALVEEAAEAAGRAVEAFPTNIQAIAALATAHNLAHDDDGEVACWQRCLELDPNDLEAYSILATRATDKGDYAEAERLLHEALRVRGASAEFAELLGLVLTDQGKFPEAARALEDGLVRPGASERTRVQLGEVYLHLKQFPKAKEQFEQAIRQDRTSSRAYYGLARTLGHLGAKQEAEKAQAEFARLKRSEKQAALKRRDADAHRSRDEAMARSIAAEILTRSAKVYFTHQQTEVAERYLRRAAELEPDDAVCRAALVELYVAQGELEKALAAVEELRRLEPLNLTHLKNLGMIQGRLGRWDAAEKTFRELCALAPGSAVGYAGLAESYLRAGTELVRARALAARAAMMEPSAWNYSILGAICERRGDVDAARFALQKAVALEPNNPQYRQMLASVKGKE